jgi:hypothetical protein
VKGPEMERSSFFSLVEDLGHIPSADADALGNLF